MKIEKQVKKSVKIALIFLAIGLLIGTIVVFAATPSSTFYISSGIYPGAPSYTVWKEGSNYFAKDANGLITYSGTNKTTITQNAIDGISLTIGGIVVIQNFYLNYTKLTIPLNVEVFEHWGGRTRRFMQYGGATYSFTEEYGIIKYRPSIPRFTARGACTNVILREGSLILCARKTIAAGTTGQVYFAETFSYGNYSWKGKIATTPPAGWTIYMGFGEEFPSGCHEAIFLYWNGTHWLFATHEGGIAEETVITGVGVGSIKTYEVHWSADEITFYINDVLKATHTTKTPDVRMIAFLEIIVGAEAADENVYVYAKDYQKLTP